MVLPSNDLKRYAVARGYPDEVLERLLLGNFSRWVWLVELLDRYSLQDPTRTPEVLAEAVVDATEHARDGHLLFWRTPTTCRRT